MNKKLLLGLGSLVFLIFLYLINLNQQNRYMSTSEQLLELEKNKVSKILIQSQTEAIELLKVDTTCNSSSFPAKV